MTDLELAEQKLEESLAQLEQIEDLIDDANTLFHRCFQDGYENMEKHFDAALTKLNEAKNLI